MGCRVLGETDSPVVPMLIYEPAKMGAFSRECLQRQVAVVIVGAPAAPIPYTRVRFCISAGHTKEDLDFALDKLNEAIDVVGVRYDNPRPSHPIPTY